MAVAFEVSEVVEMAERLRESAANVETSLEHQFVRWVESVAETMVDEIPRDSGDTGDSVTINYGDGLTATIGPTNRDDAGRPIGFFLNYGAGGRSPDDFIGRTAARTEETLGGFDVSEVL